VSELLERGRHHDDTKLEEPELSGFAEVSDRLEGVTYGSEEYERLMEHLDEVLEHHYAAHRHHPEHHEEGVEDMTLGDLVEMFADWKAASERHEDGDLHESIEKNKERFGLSDQLAQILHNTAEAWTDV